MNPLIVGIDEAGYGPVLGPLVVSATAFEAPASLIDKPLWDSFATSVCKLPRANERRLVIADSKLVRPRKNGMSELERTVLAALMMPHAPTPHHDAPGNAVPPCLVDVLSRVAPHALASLHAYPWYRDANPSLPLAADAGMIRLCGARWAREASAAGLSLAGIWCEPLPEGHFNQMVSNTNNKAVVLMGLTLRLVQRIADAHPDRELHIWIDKQGGRDHYRDVLMSAFSGRTLRIVREESEVSVYVLQGAPRWQVHFRMEGESHQLPIALASMVSKYLREVLMSCFNQWWSNHLADVRPTAGYYTDGMRFVRDVEPHLSRLGISRDWMVRAR